MSLETSVLSHVAETNSGIDAGYRYISKQVTPGEPMEAGGAVLKWYSVHSADLPVTEGITRLARAYLSNGRLEATGLGLAVLHRCGRNFYFLIVCTWRNSNELWETVFYKDSDAMSDFAPFSRPGSHIPTLCVWELVPVWHEQQAWVRFLESCRDPAAARRCLVDSFAGPA